MLATLSKRVGTPSIKSVIRQFRVAPTSCGSHKVTVVLNDKGTIKNSNHPPGVVFLFGWTGSSLKHLQRYSDIYEKRGEAVIKYCPSPFFIYKLHARKDYQRMSKELVELLHKNNLERRPVFFHSFSNGGAYMYYAVCNELAKIGIPVRGSIFDSTPGRSGYYLIKGSVAQVAPGPSLVKTVVGLAVFSYSEVFMRYKYLLETLQMKDLNKTEDYRYFLHRSMLNQPNLGPQLCLFSKTDQVTYYRDVEDFVAARRKMGVEVEAKLWDHSRHIKHILDHPEEYTSLVEKFFEKCQNQKNYADVREVAMNEAILCRNKI